MSSVRAVLMPVLDSGWVGVAEMLNLRRCCKWLADYMPLCPATPQGQGSEAAAGLEAAGTGGGDRFCWPLYVISRCQKLSGGDATECVRFFMRPEVCNGDHDRMLVRALYYREEVAGSLESVPDYVFCPFCGKTKNSNKPAADRRLDGRGWFGAKLTKSYLVPYGVCPRGWCKNMEWIEKGPLLGEAIDHALKVIERSNILGGLSEQEKGSVAETIRKITCGNWIHYWATIGGAPACGEPIMGDDGTRPLVDYSINGMGVARLLGEPMISASLGTLDGVLYFSIFYRAMVDVIKSIHGFRTLPDYDTIIWDWDKQRVLVVCADRTQYIIPFSKIQALAQE